jgi:hypothetical protein
MKNLSLALCAFIQLSLAKLRENEKGTGYTEYVFVALLIFVILIIGAERIGLIVVDLLSNEELQSGIEQK